MVDSQADYLSDSLKQKCAIATTDRGGRSYSHNPSAGSWNLQATEFVPTTRQTAVSTEGPVNIEVTKAETTFDQSDATLCLELSCALERLTKAPGSFSEEAMTILSIFDRFVSNTKQAQLAADSIVQYAIAYRSFTYDAASLCQHIVTSFRREFGQSRCTFRDCLLNSINKEQAQLESYVAAGARDRQTAPANAARGGNTATSGDGMWTPYEYRTYVNGLAQFSGFVFMNVLDERAQRIAAVGRAVRSTLLMLLRAADTDYLDTVLIVLKECGRPLAELYDANGEWNSVLNTLDQLLANSQPGASLLTDPSAPVPEPAAPGAACLRISVPLRNQLRRFLDQARSWTRPSPNLTATAIGVTPNATPAGVAVATAK